MMDTLFHFVFALVGGYVLVKSLGIRYNMGVLVLLSIFSLLIDLDHLIVYLGVYEGLKLHTLFVVFVPVVMFLIFRNPYLGIFSVMLMSHLIADMIQGIYGIPLLYPLSDSTYLIPKRWEVYIEPTSPVITTGGVGLAVYFGIIALIILIYRFLFSAKTLRK